MPRKTKLDILKGNVEAQELRLQEAFSTFEASKTHMVDEQFQASKASDSDSQQMPSSWDMLERIIGLEGDLLSSYREYSKELEKRVKKEEKNKPTVEAQPEVVDSGEAQLDSKVHAEAPSDPLSE